MADYTVRQQGPCDVCGKPLKAHNMGAGIPICPGIYAPGYRTTLRDQIAELSHKLEEMREALELARGMLAIKGVQHDQIDAVLSDHVGEG